MMEICKQNEIRNMEKRTIHVTAYPFAVQSGTIEVPANLSEEELYDYVSENFDNIKFDEPDLDYQGTDFDLD